MKFLPTELPEVIILEPDVYGDSRGFFLEFYHARKYRECGISLPFVQDNHSFSVHGTLRGLHSQRNRPQGKLLRVIAGEIFDVAVDIRRGSLSFGRWMSVILSGDNLRQLYVPPGFAHGFAVTSESAHVEYKCTDFYDPADELGIIWNDPDINIRWPMGNPTLSPKDSSLPTMKEMMDRLPAY